ncbi:MAG: phage terminase large subunit [Bacteroidales bacterium]|nr:phage terminase large subunit [Bacteroidales bacterium]MCM1147531.1 phage terminase large subunit [Bacteroidales bacterium]MCM1206321.1 phage terminase large subunit [Bacillota bacterium]MCM1511251.1 phage terminase large subunit [Clostridium sp.]
MNSVVATYEELRSHTGKIARQAARKRLVNFARYMQPDLELQPFHLVYYTVLDMFAHGKIRKLIVQQPPQHGKSEGSSRKLPAFMEGLNPDTKICIGSYAATIARDFNRDVQRIIDTPEYRELFPDTYLNGSNVVTKTHSYLHNSDVVEMVGHRGSLRVVGRGGSLTSKTVDVSILDDVYKDYAEGNSPIVREAAWKWYTTVVRTRLHNNSQELIVFTRWHDDDLIGRIEKSGETVIDAKCWADFDNVPPGAWVRLNFEALKTGEPTELDPRPAGAALWERRHSRQKLEGQRALDPVQFNCLYQGNPGSAEGRLYQPFKTWTEKSEWGQYIRTGCYVDVAEQGTDYLCAITYDIYKSDNQMWNEQKKRWEPLIYALVTDMEMTDESTEVTTVTVPALINRNGVQKVWVESNNGGSQFEKTISRKIRALTAPFHQSGNKESRILTASAMVNQQIIFPFGWESRYPVVYEHLTKFLRNFSANAHDDPEDVLTGIYEKELADGNTLPYSHQNRGVKRRN